MYPFCAAQSQAKTGIHFKKKRMSRTPTMRAPAALRFPSSGAPSSFSQISNNEKMTLLASIFRANRSKKPDASFLASPIAARQLRLGARWVGQGTLAHANSVVAPLPRSAPVSVGALPSFLSSRNLAGLSFFASKKTEAIQGEKTVEPARLADPPAGAGASAAAEAPASPSPASSSAEEKPAKGFLSLFSPKNDKPRGASVESPAAENARKIREQGSQVESEKPHQEPQQKRRFFFGRCKTAESRDCAGSGVCAPKKKAKIPLASRLCSFLSGFLIASGCAFYIIYYQLDEATVHLHILAKDAAYRMASVEKKLHALEKQIGQKELGNVEDAAR
ncbi:hypothetical protein TGME49_313070 [Toxoplasma gondii ME49]|uniref:Transmembrane protein n=3 Tax=Toxoplasma gondii TaxID=5811 RepID=A0A125YH91_TOXGV|nr:hypothetical protein TGME49_313070 [Toxoplasma gondii ME49]EPT25959.1 hypothetical protein TGME49_313070 [Toxoplasma gondii ME49]ESS35102.1 putative transmembrane protein [Toxoplasma gondii VEG]KYF48248.1 hypothetical protein TGARI_313070 [Toxoplasma gondii ARI]|eukprot:XP_002364519.2 hypothetical protein TGME49_313070 [Toxoplasma gondii ME49]